jgi:hypothetical protein
MDWKGLIKGVAPTIATALGGPLAGVAVKALGEKFLGKTDATEAEVAEAVLAASPEQLLSLRQIDNQFKVQMRELGIKEDELHAKDRDSARQLAVQRGIWPQVGITAFFLGGYFGLIVALLAGWAKVPQDMRDVFIALIGILTAGVPQCLNFWLGSSRGSQQKDETARNK